MAIDTYVRQILDSPVHVFDEIIEKLIGRNIHHAKIEMMRHSIEVDIILLQSIKSILKDLQEEEGLLSRFLYNTFGIELRKNKRREQLLYLGSELKTQHSKIKSELSRIHRQTERLVFSVTDLKRLEDSFHRENIYFQNKKKLKKSKFCINEIESNIAKLKKYENSLSSKHNNLKDTEKIYNRLFKKIPRYHELHEETYLMLLTTPIKK